MVLQGADPSVWNTPRATVILPRPAPVKPTRVQVARHAVSLVPLFAALPFALVSGLLVLFSRKVAGPGPK